MSKNDEQKESPKHTQFYIKDIQFTELNNHVGWTTEIIYVNKVGHVYITAKMKISMQIPVTGARCTIVCAIRDGNATYWRTHNFLMSHIKF
jgi:hypothetical protein